MSTFRFVVRDIWKGIRLASFRSKWRKKNSNNFTMPNNIFPLDRVTVGKGTYADLNVYSYRNTEERLSIGNYCSIASDVIFILSGEHNTRLFSTYPFMERYFGENGTAKCKGPITVEDDVWIGVRATVLSGVTIGRGAVIGAGSLVNKNVPPYSIYAGNKIIGKRFSDDIISKLMTVNYENVDLEKVKEILAREVTEDNINNIMAALFD